MKHTETHKSHNIPLTMAAVSLMVNNRQESSKLTVSVCTGMLGRTRFGIFHGHGVAARTLQHAVLMFCVASIVYAT